jgi:hypothetical protein
MKTRLAIASFLRLGIKISATIGLLGRNPLTCLTKGMTSLMSSLNVKGSTVKTLSVFLKVHGIPIMHTATVVCSAPGREFRNVSAAQSTRNSFFGGVRAKLSDSAKPASPKSSARAARVWPRAALRLLCSSKSRAAGNTSPSVHLSGNPSLLLGIQRPGPSHVPFRLALANRGSV